MMSATKESTAPPAKSQTSVSEGVLPPPSGDHPSIQSLVIRRAKRDDWLNKASLVLRVVGLLFSLLSFVVMSTNKHTFIQIGLFFDAKYVFNFARYEEYRYLLAVGILSTVYTAGQVLRHLFLNQKQLFSQRSSGLLDFFGDQIVAYLLISAASTSIPITNTWRKAVDNTFTNSSSASISMAFMAFVALALSAMISGFNLSTQTYI